MENESKSTNPGKFRYYLEKGKICLEFEEFNGLYKGHEKIEDFIATLKKEVNKFKRWKKYQDSLIINNQMEINHGL